MMQPNATGDQTANEERGNALRSTLADPSSARCGMFNIDTLRCSDCTKNEHGVGQELAQLIQMGLLGQRQPEGILVEFAHVYGGFIGEFGFQEFKAHSQGVPQYLKLLAKARQSFRRSILAKTQGGELGFFVADGRAQSRQIIMGITQNLPCAALLGRGQRIQPMPHIPHIFLLLLNWRNRARICGHGENSRFIIGTGCFNIDKQNSCRTYHNQGQIFCNHLLPCLVFYIPFGKIYRKITASCASFPAKTVLIAQLPHVRCPLLPDACPEAPFELMLDMRALLEHPLWHKALLARHRQKVFGLISGFFFAIALMALADGLVALMRAGTNELNLLPGETLTVSGPVAIKNPLPTDLRARFLPPDPALSFTLEGFFTGYWFGSGMWRGQIEASGQATQGTRELLISFRGAQANAQTYILHVYPDAEALREATLSFIKRYFDLNPFILAAICALLGLAPGIVTYHYGTRLATYLAGVGLVQIYSGNGSTIWCLAPPGLVPKTGSSRMILDERGNVLCEARTGPYRKGKLQLELLDETSVPDHALVCLKHPARAEG